MLQVTCPFAFMYLGKVQLSDINPGRALLLCLLYTSALPRSAMSKSGERLRRCLPKVFLGSPAARRRDFKARLPLRLVLCGRGPALLVKSSLGHGVELRNVCKEQGAMQARARLTAARCALARLFTAKAPQLGPL